ncbi:Gfo/Idh/MocA family oxidoreductase [bacterium]|nr:Gfo/Idh/MocA family oxidoreductase [bacterium]
MSSKKNGKGLSRKDFLKAAATTPVLGAFALSVAQKQKDDKEKRQRVMEEFEKGLAQSTAQNTRKKKPAVTPSRNDTLGIAFIGVGSRGKDHMRALGYVLDKDLEPGATPGEQVRKELNIRCSAVCDLYEPNLEYAKSVTGGEAKTYTDYEELLASPDVDAVVVATTDHWHAPIARAAAEAGKHVYVEKCMTHSVREAYDLREAVRRKGTVLQLGHQNRNSSRYEDAIRVIDSGILGHVTLVQCYTNRNNNNGAWFRNVPAAHGPKSAASGPRNLDWDRYVANTEKLPYDPNRFFNWSCYWDYSTGLSGQLLTHEMDVINMILQLGIPASASASGGIYHFREYQAMQTADGQPLDTNAPLPTGAVPRPDVPRILREVPDVFQVVYEWSDRGLTVVYNATLACGRQRGQIYMGNEATMDLTNGVQVFADPESKKFAQLLKDGEVKPTEPMLSFTGAAGKGLDALTSATSSFYQSLGLLYDFQNGKRVDITYLHHKNWLEHIRANDQDTLCNIEDGFQEAITAHMATLSYRTGSRVRWDSGSESLVCDSNPAAMQSLMA